MDYGILKTLHILSATVLFGTGLGTAYFMWQANRSGEIRVIAHTAARVVLADWLFTLPTVILQPLSGLWLLYLADNPVTPWMLWSMALYAVAGICWLPVVWLQIRMRNLATRALADDCPLDQRYQRYANTWFWLGVPAFIAMIGVFFLMVLKPV